MMTANDPADTETVMLVARAALLEARHAYHVAAGDYDTAKAAHYDAVHGNNAKATR